MRCYQHWLRLPCHLYRLHLHHYPYPLSRFSLEQWRDLLRKNFERHFYVPLEAEDDGSFVFDAALVHRRGIFKVGGRSSTIALPP